MECGHDATMISVVLLFHRITFSQFKFCEAGCLSIGRASKRLVGAQSGALKDKYAAGECTRLGSAHVWNTIKRARKFSSLMCEMRRQLR